MSRVTVSVDNCGFPKLFRKEVIFLGFHVFMSGSAGYSQKKPKSPFYTANMSRFDGFKMPKRLFFHFRIKRWIKTSQMRLVTALWDQMLLP